VAVREHLTPFLPRHPVLDDVAVVGASTGSVDPALRTGPVAAAPYGSAGILPISWAYVLMMGAEGLRRATQVAILNANYVARRLGPHFPVLYTGQAGLVAHECILDLRQITAQTDVTAEDVAKRLIDYGFHAPTMSFPVAGTLMVEPTESENLAELDRFCDAMIAIAGEIAKVGSEFDATDNPLKNAPHTASMLLVDDWKHGYSRADAAYPGGGDRRGKYWAPVRRIEAAYGDRNLVCACPPPEAFE
jgi:glycine dehydrogenase